jgi:GNAT superfamily N-acetyltransferase
VLEWRRPDGYAVSTDLACVDFAVVHAFLSGESYWSPGIPRETVERAARHSLIFSLLAPDGAQAGYARAVTDCATYAYLCDVFVVAHHRGRGLGRWLMERVLAHPDLQELRGIWLRTADPAFYEPLGFRPPVLADLLAIQRAAHELYGA